MRKTIKLDPVTGPLSRDQFDALVRAPFGEAAKALRKIDPLYGRAPGEKIKWRVRATAETWGVAYVEARSLQEAEDEASTLRDEDFEWECRDSLFDIEKIEPVAKD